MTELPLLVVDVQRGGPSTGLPTKTEQADLLQAMFGRNGEAPVPIVAPQSPGDCFDAALEAARIAVTYRTPVMLLSDGYLANGSEPWRIPDVAELPAHRPGLRHRAQPRRREDGRPRSSGPTCATRRPWPGPWAVPGTAGPRAPHRRPGEGRRHGNISYDPANHDLMVRTRQAKVDRIAESLPPLEVDDPVAARRKVLVLGWGSTYGPIGAPCRRVRNAGTHVAQAHLRHLNPFPHDLGEILAPLRRGAGAGDEPRPALACCCAAQYLVDVVGYNQVSGLPLKAAELAEAITELVAADDTDVDRRPPTEQ